MVPSACGRKATPRFPPATRAPRAPAPPLGGAEPLVGPGRRAVTPFAEDGAVRLVTGSLERPKGARQLHVRGLGRGRARESEEAHPGRAAERERRHAAVRGACQIPMPDGLPRPDRAAPADLDLHALEALGRARPLRVAP